MSAKSVLGYMAGAALIGLGLLFAWAASVQAASTRLPIALLMIAAGGMIIYLIQRRGPSEVVQKVEFSGGLKARQVQCPKCSAILDVSEMQVIGGVPSIRCKYCGNTFEVTEEPKW